MPDGVAPFYLGVQQQFVLRQLAGLYDNWHGLGLITGPEGSGRSRLLQEFSRGLDHLVSDTDDIAFAVIDATGHEAVSFLEDLIGQLGYPMEGCTANELMSMVKVFVLQQAESGAPPFIAVENLEKAVPNVLKIVCALADLRTRRMRAARIALSGIRQVDQIISSPGMKCVADRMTFHHVMRELSAREIDVFAERLLINMPQLTLSEEGARTLLELSEGWTGSAARLLMVAAEARLARIGRDSGQLARIKAKDIRRAFRALGGEIDAEDEADSALPAIGPSRDATMISPLKFTFTEEEHFDDGDDELDAPQPGRYGELLINLNGELKQRVPLDRQKVLIGRALHNDVVIGTNWVSRHHAIMICRDDGATIMDVNSTNGMTLNSRQVRHGELRHNDILVLGNYRLKYLNPAAAGRPPPLDDRPLTETMILRAISPQDESRIDFDVIEGTRD
jgi:type II secretory pathway predicted ATPase ExeA